MKKTEFATRTILAVLITLSLVAIGLQIINNKTNTIETVYEIITFSVAVVALSLAVLQGVTNARTSSELKEIVANVHKIMQAEEANLKFNAKLTKEIAEDLEVSRRTAEMLDRRFCN